MIRHLRLQNFKGFEEPTQFTLAPISLIYGENSAGKSTIAQALLLLKQSWGAARISDEEPLEFRGAFVDLGGYSATVTDHAVQNRELRIGFDVELPKATGIRTPINAGDVSLDYTFSVDPGSRKPRLQGATLAFGEASTINFVWSEKSSGPGLYLADTGSARTLLNLWIESDEMVRVRTTASAQKRHRERRLIEDADVNWIQNWLRRTPCATWGLLPFWNPDELREGRPGRPVGGSLESARRRFLQEFVFEWQYWVSNLHSKIGREFERVKYVGPLRRAPQRLVVESSDASRELGPRGERALRILAKDHDLVQRVNESMRALDIHYALEITDLQAQEDAVDIGDVSILSLIDSRSGIKVTLGDVGVGVSQVLPVLMQLLLHRKSTIVIEQPELHLHPRLQARLADIMIQSSIEQKNRLLIETHSEHLLLRLQRRVREKKLGSKSLAVDYVANDHGRSRLSSIPLTSSGEMVGGWPEGFFDDRLEDILGGE